MSLIKWRNYPTSLTEWVDDFFKNDNEFSNRHWWPKERALPAVNVKEMDTTFELELAAPGMKKEDFKISVENGVLRISAETQSEKEDIGNGYTRKEFDYQSFSRSFRLPEQTEIDAIAANYTEGILRLSVPKTEVKTAPPEKLIEVT